MMEIYNEFPLDNVSKDQILMALLGLIPSDFEEVPCIDINKVIG